MLLAHFHEEKGRCRENFVVSSVPLWANKLDLLELDELWHACGVLVVEAVKGRGTCGGLVELVVDRGAPLRACGNDVVSRACKNSL